MTLSQDYIQSEIDSIAMDDRIDSYLKGKMSLEEEKLFMQDCCSNPELKERAIMTALLTKSLKQENK